VRSRPRRAADISLAAGFRIAFVLRPRGIFSRIVRARARARRPRGIFLRERRGSQSVYVKNETLNNPARMIVPLGVFLKVRVSPPSSSPSPSRISCAKCREVCRAASARIENIPSATGRVLAFPLFSGKITVICVTLRRSALMRATMREDYCRKEVRVHDFVVDSFPVALLRMIPWLCRTWKRNRSSKARAMARVR